MRAWVLVALFGCGRVGFVPTDAVPVGAPCTTDDNCGLCGACEAGKCEALHFAQLSVGYWSTCGVDVHGGAWCWGDSGYGQIGYGYVGGQNPPYPTPRRVPGVPAVQSVAIGRYQGAALDTSGTLFLWGEFWTYPNLPPSTFGGRSWSALSCGENVCCGLGSDGTAWCWGENMESACGQPASNFVPVTQVGIDTDWKKLAPGNVSTCALKQDGSLFCWGANSVGELGQGMVGAASPSPVQIAGSWIDVAVGSTVACAIAATDGSVWCWGYGLADGIDRNTQATPRQIDASRRWTAVHTSYGYTCAFADSDGSAVCWGGDANLDLAIAGPTHWSPSDPVADIQVGEDIVCIERGGGWSCLGYNTYGDLGDGNTSPRSVPIPVCF